jgi:hypothetical protein
MRQWGSSRHHNGMSFFHTTIPKGVLLHHGSAKADSPTGLEWLAFEIEHAEAFASPRGPPGKPKPPPASRGGFFGLFESREGRVNDNQRPLGNARMDEPVSEASGWLHSYRTTRPLQLLYIDGMSAGKTDMGTLDTQDVLLRNRSSVIQRVRRSLGSFDGSHHPHSPGHPDDPRYADRTHHPDASRRRDRPPPDGPYHPDRPRHPEGPGGRDGLRRPGGPRHPEDPHPDRPGRSDDLHHREHSDRPDHSDIPHRPGAASRPDGHRRPDHPDTPYHPDGPGGPPNRDGPGTPYHPGGGHGGPMDEQSRAQDLCTLSADWGLDGFIRMEAGFEVIKCDFMDGMEEVQALRRPGAKETGSRWNGFGSLEQLRGLAERYEGIGSSRAIVHFSSMVSAFFFPVDLSNPDPQHADLPRLSNISDTEIKAIRGLLDDSIRDSLASAGRTVDWQDVSDIIVSRYADRIQAMAEVTPSVDLMARQVNFLLDMFINYTSSAEVPDLAGAEDRCAVFYLHSLELSGSTDELIHAAFSTVMSEICAALFRVRRLVVENPRPDGRSLKSAKDVMLSLTRFLAWPRFQACRGCSLDKVCFTPMWPMVGKEDYDRPRCVDQSTFGGKGSYWQSH